MATENQKSLLALLGPDYFLKEIDSEMCIYRKINPNYDIEISGTARKRHPLCVFVWNISQGEGLAAYIEERHFDIKTSANLIDLLDKLIHKYQDLS